MAATVLVAAVAAAPARGATLSVAPCSAAVAGVRTVPVHGAGFAPHQHVDLTVDGHASGGATTDAAGAFEGGFVAPPFSSAQRTVQSSALAAVDPAGTTATARLRVARTTATLRRRALLRSRVRMRVAGFRPGATVYLHVRRAGRTRGTFRIGRAAAPCGTASRRLRYMPLRRWSSGAYTYEFQHSRRFRADRERVTLSIIVTRGLGAR